MDPSLIYMSPKNNNQGVFELFNRSNCTCSNKRKRD